MPTTSARTTCIVTGGPDAISAPLAKIVLGSKFFRFIIAGSISIPFNVAARLLLSLVVRFEIAVVGAQLVGMFVAYLAMRHLVFGPSGRSVGSDLSRFAVVNTVSLAQTWAVSIGMVALAPLSLGSMACRESCCHLVALSTTTVTSFVLHRAFSFRKDRAVP